MKTCPNCGYHTDAKFCTECGFDFTGIKENDNECIDTSDDEEKNCDDGIQGRGKILKETKAIGKNALGAIDRAKDRAFEKTLSKISLAISALFTILGFYKMFVYENGEYSWSDQINAYVGGDAYNYIINGTYATAFFVLAGSFLLASIMLLILYEVKRK